MAFAQTKKMTSGSPVVLILTFSLPLMVGNVFQQLYTVVDTMVVGQVLGVGALAALGAADWVNWMMLGIMQGFTQGFSIRMAQNFGAGKLEDLKKSIAMSALLAGVLAVLLLIVGQLILPGLLAMMQTPESILGDSMQYMRIMFAGIPIVMSYNLLASILRALGDSKSPLYAMIVACLINIGLDFLFVAGFSWRIGGAAIATLIAQMCSAIYCMAALRRISVVRLQREHWQKDYFLCTELMKLGAPMAFQNAIISIGGMIVQSVVNSFGVLFIAGFTATNKLYGVLEVAATSYGYAMITYTGQNLGAGKVDRIKKGLRSAVIVAVFTSAVISAIMLLLGRPILSLFISGTPQEVTAALEIAYHYLAIMSYFLIVLYLLHIYRSTLQGLGDTVMPMVSGIAEFTMRTGIALLLPRWIGQEGIFYAEIFAWAGADVILLTSYYIRIRRLAFCTRILKSTKAAEEIEQKPEEKGWLEE